MRIIKKWQSQWREHSLKKRMRQLDSPRNPVPFKTARTVGVLFDATDQALRDQVLKYTDGLKKLGKEVTPIGYFSNKQDSSAFAFKGFNSTELDWFGKPKKMVIENYAQKPFDFLIAVYQGTCLPIEYIAALSVAHFRVGPYTEHTYCYDLMIDTTKNNTIPHFLKEVDFYLHKINSPHESTKI